METLVLDMSDRRSYLRNIECAARLLREGAVIAFPTETVYGLGVDGDDPDAVRKLYRLKQRPPEKQLAVYLASPSDIERHVGPLSPVAKRLVQCFMPGPLTLVVPAADGETAGIRVPDCRTVTDLVRAAQTPLAGTSANVSGGEPAATADDVRNMFKGKVAAILDDGTPSSGVASSVVRVDGRQWRLLREGALPLATIAVAVGDLGVYRPEDTCS